MPLADLINHGGEHTGLQHENVQWVINEGAMYIVTTSDIEQNQELLLDYGSKSNDDFLQFYGFVPGTNPYDDFVLFRDVESIFSWYTEKVGGAEQEQDLQERIRIARNAVERTIQETVAAGDTAYINAEPRLMLLASGAIDERLFSALVALVSSPASGANISSADAVNEADLQKAHMLLKDRCQQLLDSFPTTLEDDEAAISATGVDYIEQMLASFHASKKRLLANCVNTPHDAGVTTIRR
eukprot:gnl/TRDRNA2_/TRDRNA2_78499_c1_seq1.p1 gnl/TRDRNA2_/TRDRNA2_78499_c1~~gnl/TRDRNA2_/TRDRNA2_78499_c1_seq1.p1  ORF type:complete len:270 (-),score=36.26 gnl/TRDRNA2_/TRDRNA2_78499_c1_seq1:55-777(-)